MSISIDDNGSQAQVSLEKLLPGLPALNDLI